MDAKEARVESASAEVVNTAANAAEAIERARAAQMAQYHEETTRIVAAALKDAFGENKTTGRFIDVSRIPMICKNIENIDTSLTEIKETIEKNRADREKKEEDNDKRYVNRDQFEPVKNLVYGATGLILVAVVGAMIALVVVQK